MECFQIFCVWLLLVAMVLEGLVDEVLDMADMLDMANMSDMADKMVAVEEKVDSRNTAGMVESRCTAAGTVENVVFGCFYYFYSRASVLHLLSCQSEEPFSCLTDLCNLFVALYR